MKRIQLISLAVLSALMLSSVAIGIAQAEEWVIETDTLTELKLTEEKVSVTSSKSVVLAVPALKMTLECKKAEGSGKILSGGTDTLSVKLSVCEVVKMPACKVSEPITISATTKLAVTASTYYEKVEGKPLTTLTFPEECPLPEKAELSGAIAATMTAGEAVERTLTMSEEISKKANEEFKAAGESEYKLTYGVQSATLTAAFTLKLSGANAGKVWQPAPGTLLCDTGPVNGACPAGKNYASGVAVKTSAESVLKIVFNSTATCNEFRLEGTATSGAPLPGTFTTVVFNGCGACSVEPLATPWRFQFWAPTQSIRLDEPVIKVTCAGLTCKYRAPTLESGAITGGGPATFKMPKTVWVRLDPPNEAACNAGADVESTDADGKLKAKIVTPTPVWVTASNPP